MEPNCRMDRFLEELAKEIASQNSVGKNLFKSIAVTALTNLVTLPFGFMSFSAFRKKSTAELQKEWADSLYGIFKPGFFSDEETKNRLHFRRQAIERLYDRVNLDTKLAILKLAVVEPAKYKAFTEDQLKALQAA